MLHGKMKFKINQLTSFEKLCKCVFQLIKLRLTFLVASPTLLFAKGNDRVIIN